MLHRGDTLNTPSDCATLVTKAEDWPWSSAHVRLYGTEKEKQILCPWPVLAPNPYLPWLNRAGKARNENYSLCSQEKQALWLGEMGGQDGGKIRLAKHFAKSRAAPKRYLTPTSFLPPPAERSGYVSTRQLIKVCRRKAIRAGEGWKGHPC